jgi:hypothetical protein
MLNRFISIVDGSDYQGELPTIVRIPASHDVDGITVTEWWTATVGDANYQDVLESWMFEQGYVRKCNSSRPHALVIMKGGAGSVHHGHKGRLGEVGGSLPEGVGASVRLPTTEYTEAVDFIKNLTRSGGVREGLTLSKHSRDLLKQTVGNKPLKLYRGIGMSKDRLTEEQKVIINNLKPGDKTPDFLNKSFNTYASYTKLRSVANYYSEGKYSIVTTSIVSPEHIIADFEHLKDTNLKDEFDNYEHTYFQEDKEVLVEEPIESTILKVQIDSIRHKESALVILKGGAGSGHFGHKGIPGHQGGSLPRGSSTAKKVREAKLLNAENLPDEDKARIKSELEELADKLGFPIDKMVYSNHSGDKFVVGNDNYEAAMNYSPKTGEITVFSGGLVIGKDGITHINEQLVAHEVMHHRFRLFEKQLHRQEALINKLAVGFDDNPVLDDNYDLKPEFTELYWAVDIKQRYYGYADQRNLLYQLPVTDYGKSYIEVAKTASYGLATSNAISENLAEIAAFSDDPNVFVSTRWSKLYNEINQGLYSHKLIPKYVPLVRSDNG